ncbi:MAG TPA: glycosyltransferase family 9 protein [Flavipsychrobacter sp.]|nr:glycosyltransferase family 9 protein [Flavipsychrobacter sp.]
MKVLFIRFSSIGDIVLTTPVVRCLKQQVPDAEVHYLTKANFKSVLEGNKYIDKLHWLDKTNFIELIATLRGAEYDYILDLHHNLRSLRFKQKIRVGKTKVFSFPKLNMQKWLLTNLKINMMPDKSIVERYFETVRPLGVKNDGQGLDYQLPESVQVTNKDIPMSHWAGYVACVIGGSYFTKRLPVEQWQKLCEIVPYPLMLLGGPEDREAGDIIAAQDPIKIYNACGKFSVNESAALVGFSKVVVSNDTGLMHVGAAYKKPVISLWGNTSPEMGMFPYYGYNNLKGNISPLSIMLEKKDLKCHPCSKIGYDKCPKGHFRCMRELDMAFVCEKILEFWGKTPTK